MSKCCLHCFSDLAIIEIIQREGTFWNCSFCNSSDVLCIEPDNLTGLFELVLSCILESEQGDELHRFYTNEFKIVSDTVNNPAQLINEILGSGFDGKRFVLKEGISEYQEEWSTFKSHLIKENRFFPNNSLYGKIFSTDVNNELSVSVEAAIFLRTVEALSKQRASGELFYRARVSEKPLQALKMGSPPSEISSAGRANPAGIPYLYLAEDLNTCCQEVRPSNGSKIYVSEIRAKKDLRLVDLTDPKQKIALLKCEEEELELTLKCLNLLQQFSEELSKPVLPEKSHLDYIPTQFICEYLRTIRAYDGIVFNSSYGSGKNVVLFTDEHVQIDEPTAHTVTSVEVHVEASDHL
ncbi:hypothetical protein MACH09_05960 [Vibrio sp. MACH09]|uniref:RES domain-containing protein n=1 Tax=Vibrio sp. MACH09 TaxID=3025122 RepID=UPI0027944FCB|nr:RES domain-containing protein [Vibrio sp. MACH09]GLO60088.1 hypothetical protein MACH09_05960 [Vibrio sp. MACH09]